MSQESGEKSDKPQRKSASPPDPDAPWVRNVLPNRAHPKEYNGRLVTYPDHCICILPDSKKNGERCGLIFYGTGPNNVRGQGALALHQARYKGHAGMLGPMDKRKPLEVEELNDIEARGQLADDESLRGQLTQEDIQLLMNPKKVDNTVITFDGQIVTPEKQEELRQEALRKRKEAKEANETKPTPKEESPMPRKTKEEEAEDEEDEEDEEEEDEEDDGEETEETTPAQREPRPQSVQPGPVSGADLDHDGETEEEVETKTPEQLREEAREERFNNMMRVYNYRLKKGGWDKTLRDNWKLMEKMKTRPEVLYEWCQKANLEDSEAKDFVENVFIDIIKPNKDGRPGSPMYYQAEPEVQVKARGPNPFVGLSVPSEPSQAGSSVAGGVGIDVEAQMAQMQAYYENLVTTKINEEKAKWEREKALEKREEELKRQQEAMNKRFEEINDRLEHPEKYMKTPPPGAKVETETERILKVQMDEMRKQNELLTKTVLEVKEELKEKKENEKYNNILKTIEGVKSGYQSELEAIKKKVAELGPTNVSDETAFSMKKLETQVGLANTLMSQLIQHGPNLLDKFFENRKMLLEAGMSQTDADKAYDEIAKADAKVAEEAKAKAEAEAKAKAEAEANAKKVEAPAPPVPSAPTTSTEQPATAPGTNNALPLVKPPNLSPPGVSPRLVEGLKETIELEAMSVNSDKNGHPEKKNGNGEKVAPK